MRVFKFSSQIIQELDPIILCFKSGKTIYPDLLLEIEFEHYFKPGFNAWHQETNGEINIINLVDLGSLTRLSYEALPHEQELKMLEDLCKFELGRFLLANRGLNGYWTAYCILNYKNTFIENPLEKWLLTKAPGIIATQERFDIFKSLLQSLLRDNMHLASLPCGAMDDLLRLDYQNADHCRLTGIDLDIDSLKLAEKNAQNLGIKNITFIQRDAWALNINQEFDVLTSNGLNIYEGNTQRLIALYQQFHQAIKPGGHLIISYINPPPSMDPASPVKPFQEEDFIKQAALFSDVIKSGWQWFQTEESIKAQLMQAGFAIKQIVFDQQNIFPTILAQRGID